MRPWLIGVYFNGYYQGHILSALDPNINCVIFPGVIRTGRNLFNSLASSAICEPDSGHQQRSALRPDGQHQRSLHDHSPVPADHADHDCVYSVSPPLHDVVCRWMRWQRLPSCMCPPARLSADPIAQPAQHRASTAPPCMQVCGLLAATLFRTRALSPHRRRDRILLGRRASSGYTQRLLLRAVVWLHSCQGHALA
jgi:hypothetical protein